MLNACANRYSISSDRMCALHLFQCFDSACTIQGHLVFEGALHFLPVKFHLISYEISNSTEFESSI